MKIELLHQKLQDILVNGWPDMFDHSVSLEIKISKNRKEVQIFAMAYEKPTGLIPYKENTTKSFLLQKPTLSAAAIEFTKKVLKLNNKIETEEKVII